MSGKLCVESVCKLYDDDNHDAFTDLCRFQGRFYLTFRSCPDGHMVFPTSRIVVLASDDGRQWDEVFTFSAPDRDTRDPHFLIFNDRLFVYSGTWLCQPPWPDVLELSDHLGYGAWTDDGRAWSGPVFLEGTYGHYIWRAAAHGGTAYLCGRRNDAFRRIGGKDHAREMTQSALLASDDGLVWKTAGLFKEHYGDETAFLFEPDGSLLAVARGGGEGKGRICRSRAPFDEWTRTELDREVGGPLLVKWAGRYLVGGRKTLGPPGPRTTLYWLVDDRLEEAAELPSDGDNSYPGFVPLSDTEGLLSYYSSHEAGDRGHAGTSIYLARLRIG